MGDLLEAPCGRPWTWRELSGANKGDGLGLSVVPGAVDSGELKVVVVVVVAAAAAAAAAEVAAAAAAVVVVEEDEEGETFFFESVLPAGEGSPPAKASGLGADLRPIIACVVVCQGRPQANGFGAKVYREVTATLRCGPVAWVLSCTADLLLLFARRRPGGHQTRLG